MIALIREIKRMPHLRMKINVLSAAGITLSMGLLAQPASAQFLYINDFTDKSLERAEGTLSISSAQSQYTFANSSSFTTLPSTGAGWRSPQDGRNTYLGISDVAAPYPSAISGFTGDTTVTLNLNGLKANKLYWVSFDLFLGKSLDGNFASAPDQFRVLVNSNTLVDTSFNNYDANDTGPSINAAAVRNAGQAYSDTNLTGFNAVNPSQSAKYDPFTGADVVHREDAGLNQAYNNYSIYYFGSGINQNQPVTNRPATTAPRISFVATGDTAQIQWISNFNVSNITGQKGQQDDFWALDNLQVTDLPEPGTFGMMALGLIPLGAGLYRMRRK
jgi:hypothetical protein